MLQQMESSKLCKPSGRYIRPVRWQVTARGAIPTHNIQVFFFPKTIILSQLLWWAQSLEIASLDTGRFSFGDPALP